MDFSALQFCKGEGIATMKFAWISVKCGLLLMWFHLLTSINVFEAKIVLLADGAWQSVLDCIDRFVAVFNLGDQSISWLESAADEESSIVITFILFFQHRFQNMWIYLSSFSWPRQSGAVFLKCL